MFPLPASSMTIIGPFAQVFSYRIWDLVQVLLIGAILTPGKRTVSAILRSLGLHERSDYQNYHRVLNRAKWSPLELSRILLGLLVERLVGADEPLVLTVDETLERRRGAKIADKGVFRDAVRSSAKYTVHSYGLRWLSMMLLVKLPWSPQPWALPFLTLLAPSAATDEAAGRRHKSSIEWIMQLVSLLRRWLPTRRLILVTDGGANGGQARLAGSQAQRDLHLAPAAGCGTV